MQTFEIGQKTSIEFINDYIIERNPDGVKQLLIANGITRCTTIRDMQMALLTLVRKNGEEFISQLLEAHPDYQMIVADYQIKNPVKKVKKNKEKGLVKAIEPIQVDFSVMVNLLMYLVCVWLVIKIFKD